MQQLDERLILSATLINYLECGHLTWLDRERAEGLLSAEPKRPETAELVAAKGDEHEMAYLEGLKSEHGEALVEIATDGGGRLDETPRQGEDGLLGEGGEDRANY
jgi:hypothetical protein